MIEQPSSGFPSTLTSATPYIGFPLAVSLSRLAAKATQPDTEALKRLRPDDASTAFSLIAVNEVGAIHLQALTAENNHWQTSFKVGLP